MVPIDFQSVKKEVDECLKIKKENDYYNYQINTRSFFEQSFEEKRRQVQEKEGKVMKMEEPSKGFCGNGCSIFTRAKKAKEEDSGGCQLI